MEGFYVYDEIGKEIKIAEKAKPVKKNFSIATLILSFLLVVSILISASFAIEKNNVTDRLNEALALAKQNDNKEQPLRTSTPQNMKSPLRIISNPLLFMKCNPVIILRVYVKNII